MNLKQSKMKTEEIALSRVTENEENPRTITDANFQKLVKSILTFPKMLQLRPIVVDETYKALGGNMRTRALRHIVSMTPERIMDVLDTDKKLLDADKLVIANYWAKWKEQPTATVCNADDLTEEQKRHFIITDNTSFGEWDTDALANGWDTDQLLDWGVEEWRLLGSAGDGQEEGAGDDNSENNYERKIVAPIYEPQDGEISLSECYDTTKVDKLVSAANSAKITDEVKQFLMVAAYRHAKFNYEKIADFYAQAPKEVQQLMEDSALVIVDFDKAIEDGFVKISKDFLEQYGKEHGQ